MRRIENLDDFLALLNSVKPYGNGRFQALCPGHSDTDPSLSVWQEGDRICIKCFAGCSQMQILSLIDLKPADLNLKEAGKRKSRGDTSGKNAETVKHPQRKSTKSRLNPHRDTVSPPVEHLETPGTALGVNIEQLAETKQLPVSFLQNLGISNSKWGKDPAVRIPYFDTEGNEISVRYRVGLQGKKGRFKWRRGDHVRLYGLWRLDVIKSSGWCLLLEGESDCWTMWYHDLPALGIPGKGTWKPEWSVCLQGIEVILWQEPDALELPAKVAQDIPTIKVITATEIKDVSEAHCQGYDIPRYFAKLRLEARCFSEIQAECENAELAALRNDAIPVLQSETDIIDYISNAFRALGYGGDLTTPVLTYLSATSRLLAMRTGSMLAHLLLLAVSSAGKSFAWTLTRLLLPEDAYVEIDAASPRVLIYGDFDLQHKVLIYSEADSLPSGEDNPAASALRNLLQDGYLHYQVTVKAQDTGKFEVITINKHGPTTLITTSTRPLPDQLQTRIFTHEVVSDPRQVKDALTIQGKIEDGTFTIRQDQNLVAYQAYLQALSPWHVRVPFASKLAEMIAEKHASPRLQRDYQRILALIKSVAILRHPHRKHDGDGALLAEIEDYAVVYHLLRDTYSATVTGASEKVRKLVGFVAQLAQDGAAVSQADLVRNLESNKANISRDVKVARRNGWLVNRESRKGYPADLQLGEPLPEKSELPIPQSLEVFQGVPRCSTQVETPNPTQNEAKCASYEAGVSPFPGFQGNSLTPLSGWEIEL